MILAKPYLQDFGVIKEELEGVEYMSDEANTKPEFTFPKVIVTPTLNQIWGDIIKPFTAIAPTNSAFIDATISWEDIGNGYTLDYNSNGILWRVNAAGKPHPDDLEKFYEQQEIIQGYSDNLTAKLKSNINLDKIGIDDGADISERSSEAGDYMFGHTPNTYNSLGFSSLQLLSSGSELTDADREAGYIRVLLNNGLTYVRVRNEDGQWVIHPEDKQLAQDINNAVAKEMLLSGIVPGLLKVVGSGVKSVYNAFTQESSNAVKVSGEKIIESANAANKGGETIVGHALQKHAGRNPEIWGKIKGGPEEINQIALKHLNEIMEAPGDFVKVTNERGIQFLEKKLPDGRGVRLNLDGTFKGFLDQ